MINLPQLILQLTPHQQKQRKRGAESQLTPQLTP